MSRTGQVEAISGSRLKSLTCTFGRRYMNTRARFHAVMNFKPFDRLPLLEWAGWWNRVSFR